MDFTDLYGLMAKTFGEDNVTLPLLSEFNLDNVVEGSFLLRLRDRPKQELAKGMIRQYILGEKAKGNDIMLVVLTPDAGTGKYDSPASVKTDRMFYDSFPENIDNAIIYCIEGNVFESIYGKVLTSSMEAALG
ncbi:MAG: hypothetical protein V1734_07080 [Nanoarchaeota archaeon]